MKSKLPCSGFITLIDLPIQLLITGRGREKKAGTVLQSLRYLHSRVQITLATSGNADVSLALAGAMRRRILSLNPCRDGGKPVSHRRKEMCKMLLGYEDSRLIGLQQGKEDARKELGKL